MTTGQITAAQYKTYAGIAGTDLDARLAVLVPAAQRLAEQYCNVGTFDGATFTEYHSTTGNQFVVKCPPITSITSLSSRDSSGTITALGTTEYRAALVSEGKFSGVVSLLGVPAGSVSALNDWDGPEIEGRASSPLPAWPEEFGNIKVVYVGGYGSSQATIDPALQYALYRIIDGMIPATRRDPNMTNESIGKYSVSWNNLVSGGTEAGLSAEVRGLLQPFRRAM